MPATKPSTAELIRIVGHRPVLRARLRGHQPAGHRRRGRHPGGQPVQPPVVEGEPPLLDHVDDHGGPPPRVRRPAGRGDRQRRAAAGRDRGARVLPHGARPRGLHRQLGVAQPHGGPPTQGRQAARPVRGALRRHHRARESPTAASRRPTPKLTAWAILAVGTSTSTWFRPDGRLQLEEIATAVHGLWCSTDWRPRRRRPDRFDAADHAGVGCAGVAPFCEAAVRTFARSGVRGGLDGRNAI